MTVTAFALIGLLAQSPVQARDTVLQRGIEAETTARWNDAVIIYLDSLIENPRQPDLWVRVADIQARLGRSDEALNALEQAAAMDPSNAAIQQRLSQAYAAAGQSTQALVAITRACALSPESTEYLRAHAQLATWAGVYGAAEESYSKLRRMQPEDSELALDLARVSAWAGSTDQAVEEYRQYLAVHPEAQAVYLELAKSESWRGNYPAALKVLETYRQRFGEGPDYSRELAATLTRAGRPREATRVIDQLPAGQTSDAEMRLWQSVALSAQQRRSEALSMLETVQRDQPNPTETQDVSRFVHAAVDSIAEPRGTAYLDSDGLHVQRFVPRVSVALQNDTRLEAGYEGIALRARSGSGLEQPDGATTARQDAGWFGVVQRIGAVSARARGGYGSSEASGVFTYGLGLDVHASDSWRLAVSRESGLFVVSPRTVGLGLTRLAHSAQFEWLPSPNYVVGVDGSIEDLSDGNRRWDLVVAPRRVVARTQSINLDMGVRVRQFGATQDLANGYYDPHRYESYAITAFPYWKIGQNAGLAMWLAVGLQRDDAWRSFRLGGDTSAEATFGIFDRWMLKLSAAATLNERTQTGAFEAYGLGATLVRRF